MWPMVYHSHINCHFRKQIKHTMRAFTISAITYLSATLFFATLPILSNAQSKTGKQPNDKVAELRGKVEHIVVIYQENWSFDGLYGKFPGANNLSKTMDVPQVDKDGTPLKTAPQPYSDIYGDKPVLDTAFHQPLPPKPYDLLQYISPDHLTGDLVHRFYTEQLQINGGRMDKFIAWSDNGGLVQSYFDATNLPEGKLAQQYTLCDNFFHSAFGGSFLNHIWLIAAASPVWKDAPKKYISQPDPTKPHFKDAQVTPDGYAINTSYSINQPHPASIKDTTLLMPSQTIPTIGDRLNDAKVSWAWYSGGWNDAINGKPDELFQYHHQPFVYFENFKDGSANKKEHLKDETDFTTAVQNGTLPSVSFIKPLGNNNEHPGYASLTKGQEHVDSIVQLIMKSEYWKNTIIIIAYDENGGRWDHVSPPKIDRWGPGSRVPCIIISPFARKHFIDSTPYETVSILKLIETRYKLKPLTNRDATAKNMLNAFDFK